MERVGASPQDLEGQASITANHYFMRAIERIDEQFEKGYAQKHPELIAMFMQTSARDFHTAVLAGVIQDLDEHLQEAVRMAVESRGNE